MRARAFVPVLMALLAAGVQLPATAAAPSGERGLPLPRVMGGEAALRALGDDLGRAARTNDVSEERLRELLADPAAQLDRTGRLRFADPAVAGPRIEAEPDAAAYPYPQTFQLHSLPGANRVIYLDFDGHTVSGTAWNSQDGLTAKFYAGLNADGTAGFSESEMDIVQDVWARVAEDFAPFQVDVTTEDPGAAALNRTDGADSSFGMRALVTSDLGAAIHLCSGCQGIAYLDVFNEIGSAQWQPAFAFTATAGHDPAFLADIISHEVGHTFSLVHDGGGGSEYYDGQGVWLPIMGAGFLPLSQFSNGDYGGSTNTEDDYAVIANNGGPLRSDDHADIAASGSVVDESAPETGVISTRTDQDWFSVVQGCTGPLTIDVQPASVGPNLDAALKVQTSGGTPIATVDPMSGFHPDDGSLTGLGATYTGNQPGGTYRFSVDGVGEGNPADDGYSDYGSRGGYTVSVLTSCPGAHAPSAPRNLEVTSASNGQSATLTWDPPQAPGGSITGYTVQRSGGSPVLLSGSAASHTFTGLTAATGYTFSVTATNASGTGPAASVNATTNGPASAPTFLFTFAAGAGSVDFSWSPPESDGGLPITGYVVNRSPGGTPVDLDEFTTFHTFTDLTAGVEYTLSVRAVTAFGPGAVATTTWTDGPPSEPVFVTAQAPSPTSVKIDWEPPSTSGAAPVTSYTVGLQGGPSAVVQADDPLTKTFTGLTPDTDYTAYVRAVNSYGPGPQSTAGVQTPPAPHVPGPVEFLVIDDVARNEVVFSWQYPADWGLPDLTHFEVRLNAGSWVTRPLDPFPQHLFTGLAAGTAYTLSVRAVNDVGNGQATTVPFTTDPAVRPQPPNIGIAKSGAAGGKVTATALWTPPNDDGGSPVTTYKVTALKMSSSGAVLSKTIRSAGPDARKLVMTLAKGKYRFQVVAVTAAGTSKPSVRSNLVTAR